MKQRPTSGAQASKAFSAKFKNRNRSNLLRNVICVSVIATVLFIYMYGIFKLTAPPVPVAESYAPLDNLPPHVTEVQQEEAQEAAQTVKPSRIGKLQDQVKKEADSIKEREEKARLEMQERLTTQGDDDIPVGYVRIPKVPEGPETPDDRKLHIIFSSGCNYFQHWQAEFLMTTASYIGQRGRITRIVSGCHDKSAETVAHSHQTFPSGLNDLLVPVKELNRSVNENFGLFITPTFEGAKDFPWINKPSSIEYFIKHARPELDRLGETIVAVLDPDFVFLQPLTVATQLPKDMILDSTPPMGGTNVVRKGKPVAQQYGLGGQWVHKFAVDKIAGQNSPALKYTESEAGRLFAVGPPLILHVDDWAKLAPLWRKNMKPVLEIDNDILADMWAYCIAAAHLQLEHELLDQYMISCSGDHGEAFPWVNEYTEFSCRNPEVPPDKKAPNFIHMASNFKAPESRVWMFHKGHVPPKILDCDTPLIIEPPDGLWVQSKGRHTKQQAWVLCHIINKLNRVALDYKKKFCPNGYESRKLVKLLQDKTVDNSCNQGTDKWCFPIAQIEGLPNNWRELENP